MSGSADAFDEKVADVLRSHVPPSAKILDVGSGGGKYARICREAVPNCKISAIEIVPGISENSSGHYDEVWTGEAKVLLFSPEHVDAQWDVVILGDVIEHLPHSDGMDLLQLLCIRSRMIIVVYPVHDKSHPLFQGGDNKYASEAHVSIWDPSDFSRFNHDFYTSDTNSAMRMVVIRGYR